MHTLGTAGFLKDMVEALPQYSDDLERDFGFDIYEKMMHDYAISSSVDALREHVVSSSPKLVGRVRPPLVTRPDPAKQKEFEESEKCKEWWEKCLKRFKRPISTTLANYVDAVMLGNKVGEIVVKLDKGLYCPTAIKIKPRRSYAFVVDSYMNVVGLVGATEESFGTVQLSTLGVDTKLIEPIEKFLVFTFDPENEDPRGSSLGRSIYNMWYLKQRVFPIWFKYLDKWGSPSLIGTVGSSDQIDDAIIGSDGTVEMDDDGNAVTVSRTQQMLWKLVEFAANTALVLDQGDTVEVLAPPNSGSTFTDFVDFCDRCMTRGILKSVRATMESEYGSRADSASGENVLSRFAARIRVELEHMFYIGFLYYITALNWGEEYADKYCPVLMLNSSSVGDIVAYGNMVANLKQAGIVGPSQYPELWALLDLPEGDIEAILEDLEEQKEQQRQMVTDKARMSGDPESDGTKEKDEDA